MQGATAGHPTPTTPAATAPPATARAAIAPGPSGAARPSTTARRRAPAGSGRRPHGLRAWHTPRRVKRKAAAAEPALPGRWRRPLEGERRRRFGGGSSVRGNLDLALRVELRPVVFELELLQRLVQVLRLEPAVDAHVLADQLVLLRLF